MQIPENPRRYAAALMEELNVDREVHGKKPLDDDEPRTKKRRDNTSKKNLSRRKKETQRTVT